MYSNRVSGVKGRYVQVHWECVSVYSAFSSPEIMTWFHLYRLVTLLWCSNGWIFPEVKGQRSKGFPNLCRLRDIMLLLCVCVFWLSLQQRSFGGCLWYTLTSSCRYGIVIWAALVRLCWLEVFVWTKRNESTNGERVYWNQQDMKVRVSWRNTEWLRG